MSYETLIVRRDGPVGWLIFDRPKVGNADIVLLAARATLLDPHVSIGQVSAYETIGLVRKSPMEPILRMALAGRHERMSAERARQLGIASQVVPDDELRATAQQVGETIAQNDLAVLRATKQALWQALEVGLTPARTARVLRTP